jgi:hypothetical protein
MKRKPLGGLLPDARQAFKFRDQARQRLGEIGHI